VKALELVSARSGARLSARYRRNSKPSSSKVRSSRIQNQRLKRLGRLDGLLWREAVRSFRRYRDLISRAELQLIDWAKPAKSDRDQQSDNSKSDDGPGERTTRPQEPGCTSRRSIREAGVVTRNTIGVRNTR
jgi:hypothetical protein